MGVSPRLFAQSAYFHSAESTIASGIFGNLHNVTVDASGNVYAADQRGSGAIYKFTPGNNGYTQSTVASGGFSSGSYMGGGLYSLAVDENGNVYAADQGAPTVVNGNGNARNGAIYKFTPNGSGSYTQSTVVASGNGVFFQLAAVAVDASGNVYAADQGANSGYTGAIYEFTPNGSGSYTQSTVASGGFGDEGLIGVAVDASGNVYAADSVQDSYTGAIYKFTPGGSGSYTQSTVASGAFSSDELWAVAVDASGNVYAADQGADSNTGAIYEFTPNGSGSYTQSTIALGAFSYGSGMGGGLYGVAVDGKGNVYAADQGADSNKGAIDEFQAGSVNFGISPVKTATSAIALTFTFTNTTAAAIGTPVVLTQGACANTNTACINPTSNQLDFADAGTGTCDTNGSSHTYSAGDTCTVNVTFTPQFAGPRNGAVELMNSSGAAIATANVYGMGAGPQVVFNSPVTSGALGGRFNAPTGVAVDGSGNLYVADSTGSMTGPPNGAVYEIPAGCTSTAFGNGTCAVTALGGGFSEPYGVAVDGSGNVYVADRGGAVYEMPAACTSTAYSNHTCTVTALGGGTYLYPEGVAVDASGNVYFTDYTGDVGNLYEMPAGCTSSTCVTMLGGGFHQTVGVAVDGSGNVYVADDGGKVYEMPAGCTSTAYSNHTCAVTELGGGFSWPAGVAVDASGDVYVADQTNHAVYEIPPGCTSTAHSSGTCNVTTLGSGFSAPYGVALDGNGNVYVADANFSNPAVYELPLATPPSLSFGSIQVGSTSSEQTVTVANIGNMPLTFTTPSEGGSNPSYPLGFAENSSDQNLCSSTVDPLVAGASCDVSLSFEPTSAGSYSGSAAILTDNALNTQTGGVGSAQQSISLIGTGNAAAPGAPTIGTATAGNAEATVTFTAPASDGGETIIDYTATSSPTGLTGSCSASPCTVTGLANGTAYTFTVTATNSVGTGQASSASNSVTPSAPISQTTLSVTENGSAVTTVAIGTVVTLTATAQSGATSVTTGQVNFCDASPCTGIHLLGTAQLTSSGTAELKLKPGIGSHSYQAVFVGTSSYGTSTSSAASLSVTGSYATTTAIAQSGSAGNYTLTATVTGSVNKYSAPPAPTGTVSFLDTTNSNAVLGTASLGSGTLTQGFAGQVAYTAGTTPVSVAVGDFNGDGIPDLAVANFGSSTVSIFLGNGDGTFQSQVTYTTGSTSQPTSVAVGDFNGDGISDLAVTSGITNTVSVFLGNGDGTFQPQFIYTTGSTPTSVAVGDFNGDGIPDLAVANYGSGTVSIFLGEGDGTFPSEVTYATGGLYPRSVAVGDFNGDGIPDLAAVIQPRNTVSVLLGNVDGTFQTQVSYPTGSTPISVVVGDFNGDGIADLAVANLGDNTVSVLLGKGDGTFNTQVPYSTGSGPVSVAVGDFNGDGIADFAVANQSGNTVSVLSGKGDGTFNAQVPYATGAVPNSVAVGDFNGDGIPDLAVANNSGSTVSALLGQWTETATASASGISPVGPSGSHVVAASYPGDSSFTGSTSSTTSLTSQPAATTLTLGATPSSSTYGQQVALTATLSPYTAQGHSTDGETVTFSSNGASLGTGTLSSGVATLNVTSLLAGADSLTATYAGESNFAGSSTTTPVSFNVSQVTPVITWATPPPIVFGTPVGVAELNASANVPGTFSYNPPAGSQAPSGGILILSATFTPTDTTDYTTATAEVSLTVDPLTPTITAWPTASPITYGQTLASSTLTGGTVAESGTFAWTTGSTVPSAGTNSYSVTFTPFLSADFNAVTGTVSLTVTAPNYVVSTNLDDSGLATNCTPQSATTSNTTDSACSLRDALLAAGNAGAANIYFDSTNFASATTITLSNGTLQIPTNTAIHGATSGSGATLTNLVTVSGANTYGVFSVSSGVTGASIANLTIANGNSTSGGGISNRGTLTVTDCTLSGNSNDNSSGRGGGGIDNAGTLTVTNSTFSGNSTIGIELAGGGGIYNTNALTIANSTFYGNSATSAHFGGGAVNSVGTVTITGSTFSGNSAPRGGGIYKRSGTLNLSNSIVAGNTASFSYADIYPAYTDGGGNQANTGSGATSTITPDLAPLGNYGGPTQTMIPLPGSPAICAGTATPSGGLTLSSSDQRGEPSTTTYGSTMCVDAGAVHTNYSISFAQQPSNVVQGTSMSPAPTVELDESGAPFTGSAVTIPLTLTGSGMLSGGSVATSTSTGIASYSALSVSAAGSGDSLTANLTLNNAITPTAPSVSVTSSTFAVFTLPTQLAFSTPPIPTITTGGYAGSAITVNEENSTGALANAATDTITLTVSGPNSYLQTYTATASGGTATFDLSSAALTTAGSYTYTATSGSLTQTSANEAVVATSVNLGANEDVGSSTSAQTVTMYISTAGTLGSINVFTQGAAGLDFTQAASPNGGTCTTGMAYTVGQTCTVNVIFMPKYPGARQGAVVLVDSSGTVLGTAWLSGTGVGPQMIFPTPNRALLAVGSGFHAPSGVAVDGAGDVFVGDGFNNRVYEIVAVNGAVSSSSTVNTVAVGLLETADVAVDGAGDVFVADYGHSVVKEIVAVNGAVSSSSPVITVGSGFQNPIGVAVDGAGNVFVGDYANNAVKEILAVNGAVSSSSPVKTIGSGFNHPRGVAVDAAGDVFVADFSNSDVKEIVAVNSAVSSTSTVNVVGGGSGFGKTTGVAVDAAGNVFFSDFDGKTYEIVAANGAVSSSSTVLTLNNSGVNTPAGVALDAAGDVFITPGSRAAELPLATPPLLTFASTDVGASSTAQTVTVANDGNATLTLSGMTVPTNWTAATGTGDCSSTSSLEAGVSCSLSVTFAPQIGGSSLTDNVTLTDNAPGSSQQIALSGTAVVVPTQLVFSTAPAANILAGGSAGSAIAVNEENATGLLANTATDTITLAVTGPNSYSQTYTATASGGVATFNLSSVALTAAGGYGYSATSGSYTEATASETVNASSASTVNVVSGSGQSAVIGAAFATALTVKVLDSYGNPVSGATVTFSGPASGAGASLSSTMATTASDGTASVTATANGTASSTAYAMTASVSGTNPVSFMLTNTQQATTLTVTPSAAALVYGQPVMVNAAISPASVLTSAPTGSITFYDGGTTLTPNTTVTSAAASYILSVPAVGSHSYAAQYLGDTNFSASTQTSAASAAVVSKAASTLSGPSSPVSLTYGTGGSISIAVAGQYSGTGIAQPSGSVTYTIGSGTEQAAAISSGIATLAVPTSQTAGTYNVSVSYSGDGNYSAASNISVSLSVAKATATVTLGNLTATYDGNSHAATATTNPVGLTVDLTYNGASTTPTAAGSYAVTATINDTNYTGSASGTLTINKATPTISWTAPAAISYSAALSATQLNASSSVEGAYTYSPASGTVLTAGAHTLSVTFTPTDTTNYTTATQTVALTVNQATPTINWTTPAAITYGTALSATQLDASSTVAGSFAYTPASGTTLAAGAHTLSVTFTPTDTTNYTTATQTVSLTVNQATPTINWTTPAAITYGTALSATQLDASSMVAGSFAYTPASGTTLAAGAHTLSVTFTPTDTTNYTTATQTVALTVNQATPTINWTTPAAITYGTALSATQLDASSTVAGSFAYTPASGTTLAAGAHTLSVTFTPTDTTNYTTATQSVALTVNQATPTISWEAPAAITYGTALSAAQLDASASFGGNSSLAGTYTYTPASGTVLAAGTQSLSVAFTPTDTTNYITATQTVSLAVNKAIASLSGPEVTLIYGSAGSARVTVTGQNSAAVPSGNVSYSINGGAFQTATLVNGTAELLIPGTLDAGSYSIPVSFVGDTNYQAGTGTIAMTVHPQATSEGDLTWLPSSPVYNASVQFKGSLTPAVANLPATAFNFLIDHGTPNSVFVPAAGYSGGAVTASYGRLTAGPHTVALQFIGTPDYSASTSGPITIQIGQATPSISWTPAVTIGYGNSLSGLLNSAATYASSSVPGSFSYSAQASGATAVPVTEATTLPAGSYTLTATFTPADTADYKSASASSALAVTDAALTVTTDNATKFYGAANPAFTGNVTGAVNGDSFAESFTTTASAGSNAGTYAIVPSVTGPNVADYSVTLQNGTLTVAKAGSGVALASSTANANLSASVTFTAAVTSTTTGLPTGQVQFLDGSTVLGTETLNMTGVATYTTSSLVAGAHTINAIYVGDGNFNSSTISLAQQVTAPDYSLTADPSSLTLKAGQTGKVTFTFTPVGGFSGTVNFSCAGLPANASCSFAPPALTADGSNTVETSLLTIATLGPNLGTVSRNSTGRAPGDQVLAGIFWLPGLLLGSFLLWERKKLSVRAKQWLSVLMLATAISGMIGCGYTTPPTNAGSNVVSVTATATGNGSASHTATFTLTITQ